MNKTEREMHFEKVVAPLRGYIQSVASRYISDYLYVEDIAQIVLAKAWRNLDRLPSFEEQLKHWLYVTVKTTAIDYLRAQRRREAYEVGLESRAAYMYLDEYDRVPMTVCEPNYLPDPFVLSAVKDFLTGLSFKHKEVLLMSICDMTYEEMASATGSSLGTVRSRLHHARKKAKRALASHL